MKTELLSMTKEELKAYLTQLGQPAFRAGQVFRALHAGLSFEQMTDLSKDLRQTLSMQAADCPVGIIRTLESRIDGTRKYLFRLHDGECIEGVLMRYKYGLTLCVSTQVGCRMGCGFCASTLNGLVRDLTAGEILGQIICVNRTLKNERVHNVVLMGSGEPFDNYDSVVTFLHLVSEPDGLNIGLRRISVSTCGIVPKMLRFCGEGLPVTLSVSLHAPNDAVRRKIMPVANAYAIRDILEVCRKYIAATGRRVVFEYALISGVNETPEHAGELSRLLRGLQCHVNVIPLNDVPERDLKGVSENTVRRFLAVLDENHISATRRREMGDDIMGACGQLRRSFLKEDSE